VPISYIRCERISTSVPFRTDRKMWLGYKVWQTVHRRTQQIRGGFPQLTLLHPFSKSWHPRTRQGKKKLTQKQTNCWSKDVGKWIEVVGGDCSDGTEPNCGTEIGAMQFRVPARIEREKTYREQNSHRTASSSTLVCRHVPAKSPRHTFVRKSHARGLGCLQKSRSVVRTSQICTERRY
jgi:hypothetical protein